MKCLLQDGDVVDIVLVHGIMGGASWTWRQHDCQGEKNILSHTQRKNLLNSFTPGKDESMLIFLL